MFHGFDAFALRPKCLKLKRFCNYHFNWHFPLGYGILNSMKETTVQIDQAGRVVLPKPLRDRFRLRGGDTLAVEVRGDAIELRPTQASGQLKRVNGVLVFTSAGPVTSEDFVARSRDERIDDLMGSLKKDR
jgi:AbrB family looped-hinge helix DNA binding protein